MTELEQPINNKPGKESIPWEDKEMGLWRGFWLNWIDIMLYPRRFFSRLPKNKEITPALLFLLFSYCIYLVMQIMFSQFRPSFEIKNFLMEEVVIGASVMLAGIFLISGIIYLFIFIFKAGNKWQNVFRTVCYVESAIILFGAIPFLGVLVGFIWGTILIIVGIKNVFNISMGKAISISFLSFFTFMIFILGLGIALYFGVDFGLSIFKPELFSQKLEKNAIINCKKIVNACRLFKEYKGYYPLSLSQLSSEETPYLGLRITRTTTSDRAEEGYFFEYAQIDDRHYTLFARPVKKGRIGAEKTFFADESGIIKLNDINGLPVKEEENNN